MDSQNSKRRRPALDAASAADKGTCEMSVGGLPWTQLGSAGDASELGREAGSGGGGSAPAGAAAADASSAALYEVLTRLLLVAERIRASS